jgi:hypothetical protein
VNSSLGGSDRYYTQQEHAQHMIDTETGVNHMLEILDKIIYKRGEENVSTHVESNYQRRVEGVWRVYHT